jgi:DNA-directed RNA polymerase subunit alpha
MRIRWRDLELPSDVSCDESLSSGTYGRFSIEPFERGFGITVGNSMRRVLLSSLEGAAVANVKITGAPHEFMSIPGVLEDVTEIILNVKGLIVVCDADGPKTMKVSRNTAGDVLAGDIVADPAIEIVNPDHVIATLTDDVNFEMEMTVRSGRGYRTALENRGHEHVVGVIPIDSVYSPVERVRYRTEDTRVGQRTNYDRLILEVWTNGTITPEDAIVEAGKILRKHLNPFVQYHELGEDFVRSAAPVQIQSSQVNDELDKLLSRPVADLELSVRASNCLEAARVLTVGELVRKTEPDLLRLRSFGKTSLREVRRKLADLELSLGMVFESAPSAPSGTESPGLAPDPLPSEPAAMDSGSSEGSASAPSIGATMDSSADEVSVPADPT